MKIAIVHSYYRSGPSGENLAVDWQARALMEAGHDIRVISKHSDKEMFSKFYSVRAGATVATGRGPSPVSEIERFGPDLIHVHNLFPNWSDHWLVSSSVPFVATVHNFRALCAAGTLSLNGNACDLCPTSGSFNAVKHACYRASRLQTIPLAVATRKPANNRLLNLAQGRIFLNDEVLAHFKRYIPNLPTQNSVVIPNFVNRHEPVEDFSENSTGSWVFVGRLAEEKGILPLVQHWPVKRKLLVVGTGPQEEEARRLSKGKQIQFLGVQKPEDIPRLLRSAIGTVVPSISLEHGPFSFIESMSVGTPAIAKSGNGASAVIEETGAGSTFDRFEDLPEAILKVENNRHEMASNARVTFENRYEKKTWLNKVERFYSNVLQNW